MKREYDGFNDEALADPTADCRELITGADFDGDLGTFWLRYIIIRESGGANDAIVSLYDQDEGVAVAANLRAAFDLPKGTTQIIEFPAPGLSFKTNITAGLVAAAGTVAIGNAHAGGYLIGSMKG